MSRTDTKDDDRITPYILAGVLNDAWRELVNDRDPQILDKTLTRPELARRIMHIVRRGERNVETLKAGAKASQNHSHPPLQHQPEPD